MKKLFILLGILALFAIYLKGCGGGGGGGRNEGAISSGGVNNVFEASGVIGPSGGVIQISNPSHALYGVKIEIPPGALENEVSIIIEPAEIEPPIPDTAKRVSRTVKIKPDNIIFMKPVSITIPYDPNLVSDEDSLQIYSYNGYSWEGLPSKNRDKITKNITSITFHFSEMTVLEAISPMTNTKFVPAINGFRIKNSGTPGNCFGMVTYAKWFFEKIGCSLYKAYDDETSQEIARATQDALPAQNKIYLKAKMFVQSDENVFKDLTTGLKISGAQILGIYEGDAEGGGNALYHAVLVYKYDPDYGNFYVYDPNYSGKEKIIKWYGTSFESYYLTPNCSLFEDCYKKRKVDYVVLKWEYYFASIMEAVFNSFPFYAGGNWNYSNNGTVTCSYNGDIRTENPSGSGNITINQSDSNLNWTVPVHNIQRAGTIIGNNIQVSGEFALARVDGVNFTENIYKAEGTICGDKIVLKGSGKATGTYDGINFSCSGTDTITFTRSNP